MLVVEPADSCGHIRLEQLIIGPFSNVKCLLVDNVVNAAKIVLFDCWNIDTHDSLHPPFILLIAPYQLLELKVILDRLEVKCHG